MSDGSKQSGCVGMLMALIGFKKIEGGPPPLPEKGLFRFPYRVRDAFLSPAEISFFHVIKGVLGPEHHLISKVNLWDLFYVEKPQMNQAAINRIDRKHVDFVICDAGTMQPVLAIELDDSSHQSAKAKETDAFKDDVFKAAGLPLLRVAAARGYDPRVLAEQMNSVMGGRVPSDR
jgi:very-short-patch-repair endonuclease